MRTRFVQVGCMAFALAIAGSVALTGAAVASSSTGSSLRLRGADGGDYPHGGSHYPSGGIGYPHGGAGRGADGLTVMVARKKKTGKLPFRTGATIVLASSAADAACDVTEQPNPYGPYGPGGATSAPAPVPAPALSGFWNAALRALGFHTDSAFAAASERGSSRAIKDDSSVGKSYYPDYPDYGGGGDDLLACVVWCNASLPDSEEGGASPPWGVGAAWEAAAALGRAAVTAAALGRKAGTAAVAAAGGSGALQGSQWDTSGFILLGTDYTSPDVYDGSTVYLKNQNTRKFCRVAGTREDEAAGLAAGELLCDQMMSGEDTEFVVELVAGGAEGGDDDPAGGWGRRLLNEAEEEDEEEEDEEEEEEEEGHDDDEEEEDHHRSHHEGHHERDTDDDDGSRHAGHHEGHRHKEERKSATTAATAASYSEKEEEEAEEAVSSDYPSGGGDWPSGGGDWPSGGGDYPSGGGGDWPSGGGDWPSGGGDDGGDKKPVLIRLRSATNRMRYCAPDLRRRGAPILCDLRHPDRDATDAASDRTTFQIIDASAGSYPPYPGSSDGRGNVGSNAPAAV